MSTKSCGPLTRNCMKPGFTLIELLIVMVIIGIVSTVTLYYFGDFGADRKAKVAAEHMISYLKLLEQHAILETSTFGIKINHTTYDTYRLGHNSQWSLIPKNHFFHQQILPTNVTLHLEYPVQNHSNEPDIMIHPSGNITAFKLLLGTPQDPALIQLIGQHHGEIILQKVPSS